MANNVNRPAGDAGTGDRPLTGARPATEGRRETTPAVEPTSSAVHTETAPDDHSAQEAWLGTDDPNVSRGNASWGAIIAGTVTFIALTLLIGVGAAALGLQDFSGTVVGIWTLVGLVIAFVAAGYVSGVLAVRSGLLHGFVTWATSVLAVIFLAGWLGTSAMGALGSVAGTVATTASEAVNVTTGDAQSAAENTNPQQAQDTAGQVAQDAQQAVEEAAPEAAAGSWWTFAGLLIGAVLASLAGAAGARSVINKREEYVAGPNRG
ncbi:TIGR04086 family membrane protein [Corynebacterium halotolerans]|uniref:Uncharacterized protein n=1 Tax=Corynebacterium halotolerans YIM 70093 = DSM 44683 TaxID=1121362 RepID=M1MZH9_9CORY|nr:TIGR04086 family membrane protein [Corynebacterium halotolerans]AGF73109.1 hypothetical protein A605_10545 [Corynebacterium halotolerans YIM 70093 = DSM 44683]